MQTRIGSKGPSSQERGGGPVQKDSRQKKVGRGKNESQVGTQKRREGVEGDAN